ncbi:EthD domain-containing protein [Echria macrotheca]|uniref:EthD domain-containing protein n=1 Tax=Echria macrotheca TaxID=438768 RepID=A0AAJ0B597_9PEZI|nr:EthD domain-containing protein [Echria macrotheca]
MSPFEVAAVPSNMDQTQQAKEPMLCLTICAYRKEGLDEEEYRDHMLNVHAPLVRGLMVKHGIDSYSMSHAPLSTRSLMGNIFDAQFANVADYDCIVQIRFRRVEQFMALKDDPEYKRAIMADHEKFADTKNSKMTIGWIHDCLQDGVIL